MAAAAWYARSCKGSSWAGTKACGTGASGVQGTEQLALRPQRHDETALDVVFGHRDRCVAVAACRRHQVVGGVHPLTAAQHLGHVAPGANGPVLPERARPTQPAVDPIGLADHRDTGRGEEAHAAGRRTGQLVNTDEQCLERLLDAHRRCHARTRLRRDGEDRCRGHLALRPPAWDLPLEVPYGLL